MIDLSIKDFLNLNESEKCDYVKDFAILYAQQFDRSQLDFYCHLSDEVRRIHKTPEGAAFLASLLPHQLVLNFFVQPSSRTFMSFNAAQVHLGLKRMSVRDAKISSMSKGETLEDSIRTFLSYVDLVIMRHPDADAGAVAFWTAMKAHRRLVINGEERPVPIISGGSGTKQHPTQSLLDIYTLEKSFESFGSTIDGKTIMMVGDLKRGRTVRSLSYLMKNYKDVKILYAAPERYQMQDDILAFLEKHDIQWEMINSIDEGIETADAIYMTRIQDEWNKLASSGHEKAANDFIFTTEHLNAMKDTCYLLHPLPKRDEIVEEIDYLDDHRIIYWRQERNGMWMRIAIIAKLFGIDQKIIEYAKEH